MQSITPTVTTTEPKMYVVATFYKFSPLKDLEQKQKFLHSAMVDHHVVGTILLAHEGVNGTICGPRSGIDYVLQTLRELPGFSDLVHQESYHEKPTFAQTKVKIKPEIVTLGLPSVSPAEGTGEHVTPEVWNELLKDPSVVVLDTRNRYEVRVGTFERAIDPEINSFREFPDYVRTHLDPAKHKKIAMFCTGGIRCEKASAFMLKEGFAQVFQLKGGILSYIKQMPSSDTLWKGDCFVFDERVGVNHTLGASDLQLCALCGDPLTNEERQEQKNNPNGKCRYCPAG